MLIQNKLLFVPGMQFQPSLIFASKARSYPNRASCFFTLMLHKIIFIKLKILARDKPLFNPKKRFKISTARKEGSHERK